MNKHIELPALNDDEINQLWESHKRAAWDRTLVSPIVFARSVIAADRAAQQRGLAEQAEPDDPNYPFYELKFIMRVQAGIDRCRALPRPSATTPAPAGQKGAA